MKELQEARTLRNTIATIKTQIEYILWLLANTPTVVEDLYHYEATTKAGLPDPSTVPRGALGVVNGVDADNGLLCTPDPTGSSWASLNFWD